MMTARTTVSSPASSRARSSEVVQAASGSPRNTRYRARRRRSSARAGPGGVAVDDALEQGTGAGRIGCLEALLGCQDGPASLAFGPGERREGDGEFGKIPGRVAGPAMGGHPGGRLQLVRHRLVRALGAQGQVAGPRLGATHDRGQTAVGGAAIGGSRLLSDYRAHQRVDEDDIAVDIGQQACLDACLQVSMGGGRHGGPRR